MSLDILLVRPKRCFSALPPSHLPFEQRVVSYMGPYHVLALWGFGALCADEGKILLILGALGFGLFPTTLGDSATSFPFEV